MKTRVAIVGSRNFGSMDLVREYVARLDPALYEVWSGGARGVDSVAADAARRCGLKVVVMEANWSSEGRAAGMLRNARLIQSVDAVVAFWDGTSRGTMNAIGHAQKRGIWLRVVKS